MQYALARVFFVSVREIGVKMTNQRLEDERITLAELLEIIFKTIREYEGTTGIFRKHNKEQG
jgi:hypothetical protein